MTIKDKQVQLAKYRLKQAVESIDEAFYLLSGRERVAGQLLIGSIMLCFMRYWH